MELLAKYKYRYRHKTARGQGNLHYCDHCLLCPEPLCYDAPLETSSKQGNFFHFHSDQIATTSYATHTTCIPHTKQMQQLSSPDVLVSYAGQIEMTFFALIVTERGQPLQFTHFCLALPHWMETITFAFWKTSKGQSCSVLQRRYPVLNFQAKVALENSTLN